MIALTPSKRALIIILVGGSCFGCADSRVQRPNDEAMMIYRDCMSGMPPPWDAHEVSATLGSERVASASASADSHREWREHDECVQRAGWVEK